MRVEDLAPPSGEAVRFTEIGDRAVGVISHIGEWRDGTNKFGKDFTSFKCVLQQGDGTFAAIYPEKGGVMARVIGEAVKTAGETELKVGGKLAVEYSGNQDVGKGNPMKLFTAKYVAPAPTVASRSIDDLI